MSIRRRRHTWWTAPLAGALLTAGLAIADTPTDWTFTDRGPIGAPPGWTWGAPPPPPALIWQGASIRWTIDHPA